MPADLQKLILNSDLIYQLVRNLPNPEFIEDETANDSNKTFTVPANQIYELIWVYVEMSTAFPAGNRYVTVAYLDSSDDILMFMRSVNAQIVDTNEYYVFSQNVSIPAEPEPGRHFIPLPLHSFLPAGYKINVYDSGGAGPGVDDMIVHMMVNRFDV